MNDAPEQPPGDGEQTQATPRAPGPDAATLTHFRGDAAPQSDSGTLATSPGGTGGFVPPPELAEHPRYRVIELLGGGGMGAVYKAEHRLMERVVALKVINAQFVTHPGAIERFRREWKAAARLSHPRIVAAYDAEQAGRLHFLVMEFVEGTSLGQLLRQRGRFSVTEAREYVHQAALGLQFAHGMGMVHRDIKPHNLMLTKKGQIKILDFGLARFASETEPHELVTAGTPPPEAGACEPIATQVADEAPRPTLSYTPASERPDATAPMNTSLTTVGSMMGTADYVAPEQIRDAHSADIRADIYSMGCTLYHLVSGEPPFADRDTGGKLLAHQGEEPKPLHEVCPEVSPELSAVVAKMLAKDPAARYQTPAEAAAALLAAPALATEARQRAVRSRRLRWLWPAAAAALLLALALPAVLVGPALYRLAAGHGTLLVDGDDARGRLIIEAADGTTRTVDLGSRSRTLSLPAGEYRLRLDEDATPFSLSTYVLRIAPGDRRIVSVSRFTSTLVEPLTRGRPGRGLPSQPMGASRVKDFAAIHDATLEEYKSWLDRQGVAGYRAASLSVVSRRDEPRFTAIAFLEDPPLVWSAITDANSQEYQEAFNARRNVDLRPINCVCYQRRGQNLFASLWTGSGTEWAHHHVLDDVGFRSRVAEYGERGMRPNCLATYWTGSNWRLASNWVRAPAAGWQVRHHLTADQCQAFLSGARAAGLRPDGLSAYDYTGGVHYFTCLVPDEEKTEWSADLALSEADYLHRLAEAKSSRRRPLKVSSFDQDGANRYAVIWIRMEAGGI